VQLARLRQEVTDLSEATQHARALQQERQELIAAQERKVREVDAELATMLGHIKELTAEAAAAEEKAFALQKEVVAWELLGGQKDTDARGCSRGSRWPIGAAGDKRRAGGGAG